METDGGREFIQGKIERKSGLQGVWGRTRGWIPVESHDDSTQEGRTTATPLAPPDDWGAQDVQNEFSNEGRQATVPGGGMPGGVRDTIPVESHDDSTREGRTTTTPLGPPDDWGGQDIQNEFSDEGRQATVPGGGMPRGVSNTSGNAGALRALACPRHRGHIGGGKPPPTTVPPVRPVGLQEGAQWAPPGDQPM